jgi:type I restriction enzyme S subunit
MCSELSKDDAMTKLPPGWEWKKLGDVCEVITDGDWIESKDQSDEGIRLIQTGNIGQGFFKNRSEKARFISEKTFSRLKCTEIFENDCLISRLPDPIGRSCIIPNIGERMITAVDCTIIRFKKREILPMLFNYFSQSKVYMEDVLKEATGTTRNRISRKNLSLIDISIPPLGEQKRIVAVLDNALESIKAARGNAEKNLANAKELFESYLDGIEAHKCKINDFITIKTGKLDSNAAVNNGKYPFFTCSREIFSINSYAFDCEAVLLAGNNATGDFNVKYYKGKFNAYQRTYVIIINDTAKISYSYLYYNLVKSLKGFKGMAKGVGTKYLKIGMIQNLSIPIPSKSMQDVIIRELDAISSQTQALQSIYTQKIAALDELKQSILEQAFRGEIKLKNT